MAFVHILRAAKSEWDINVKSQTFHETGGPGLKISTYLVLVGKSTMKMSRSYMWVLLLFFNLRLLIIKTGDVATCWEWAAMDRTFGFRYLIT